MATRHGFYTFEPGNVTLSGLTVTAVDDQSGNGYDLANAGAPQYEQISWTGHPAVVFDGVDDTLKQTTGLANVMMGGTDKACIALTAFQFLHGNASGDAIWSCGDNASANPFYRFVSSGSNSAILQWDLRKRDAATGAGAGAGAPGSFVDSRPHVATVTATGTTFSIKIDNIAVVSGAMDVGDMGTLDTFAIACLSRNTDSAFCAIRIWALDIYDTLTAAEELDLFTLYNDKYVLRQLRTCGDHFRRRI